MWRDHLKRRRQGRFSPQYQSATRNQKIAKFAKIGFFGLLVLTVIAMIAIPILSFTLPSPDKIVRHDGFSTQILDRNGKVLYDIFADQRRTSVDLADIPVYLRQGTIAIEDKNFYQHQGFDPTAYLRILYNLAIKRKLIGGSTLTQQLVKNVLLTSERTVVRKAQEAILAIQIESRYSKDQILQLYLNEVPYGGTAFGVESASEIYFGKNVKDLNLVESAFLAGLPQRPSAYSPYSSTPKAYVGRTQEVLRRMREDGYITTDQEKEAKDELESLEFQPRGAGFKAPHFVQYVQSILEDRYGASLVQQGGLKVTTTLDIDLQDKAQQVVSDEIEKVESLHITNGAAVVMNPQTGEILAMVGSKDFNAKDYDGQVNVTTSLRQPGSSIKPIVYVTAFKKGYTPATLLMDVPTEFPGGANNPPYQPENYDGKFRGPIQVRFALANSVNVPAVKMLAMVGIKDALQTGYDLGITSYEPTNDLLQRVGLSLALGGGEVRLLDLTDAYAAFMNEGYRVDPVSILKVEDHDGKILENNTPQKGRRVLSAEQAFLVTSILSDNNARKDVFGLNSLLNISGRQIAVKTGTTNDKRDNWTIGGNPDVLVGVWVGNNDNTPMRQVASGITGASPIWRGVLLAALQGRPNTTFKQPDGVVTAEVDEVSGYRAHDGFSSRTEYFVKGTEPGEDPVHVNLKVCKSDGNLATPSQVAAHDYNEKEYFVFKEEDPTAGPSGENKWQKGILDWLSTQTDPKYHPPTDYCSGTNLAPLNVEFVGPHDRESNLSNDLTINFTVDAINPISVTELEIDGQKVRSFTGPPYSYDTNLSDGVHNLRAVAIDSNGNQSDRKITIGVNTAWDATP